MTNLAPRTPHRNSGPTPILRWTLQRNAAMLTCEVDVTDGAQFDVSVVPHWDIAAATIERFDAPISALGRHADIVVRLREAGWAVTDRAA